MEFTHFNTTVLWGTLALWGRSWTANGRWAISAVLVRLVAFSRLALGVHYLVEVLASIASGLVYLSVMWTFVRGDSMRAFDVAIVVSVLATVVSSGSRGCWLSSERSAVCWGG